VYFCLAALSSHFLIIFLHRLCLSNTVLRRIRYRVEGKWESVRTEDKWDVEKDKYNKVVSETVKTEALRMEVQLREKFSAGIHEWTVRETLVRICQIKSCKGNEIC
jgi:hypothetical protein